MATTQDGLHFKMTADANGFVSEVNRVQKAQKAVNTGNKRAAQGFTQLAYGLDDVQYGFRGLQNNLQAAAVGFGVGGPILIGLTALLIGINVIDEAWRKAGREAAEAAKIQAKALTEAQGPIASVRLYAQVLRTATQGTDEHKYALEELKKKGYDPAKESLEDFLRLQEAQIILNAVEKASSDVIAKALYKRIEAVDALTKAQKRGGQTAITGSGLGLGSSNQASLDQSQKTRIAGLKKDIEDIDNTIKKTVSESAAAVTEILGEDGLVSFITRKPDKANKAGKRLGVGYSHGFLTGFKASLVGSGVKDAIDNAFSGGINADTGSNFSIEDFYNQAQSEDGGFKEWKQDRIDEANDAGNEIGQALQASLTNAFVGLGDAVGQALEGEGDFGEKFLSILGSFMKTFGAAIIAVGVAALQLEIGLSTGQAWLAIGAGVALVAAGAALSSRAAKGVDGKGSTASGSVASSASSNNPQSIQNSIQTIRIVGEIDNQVIRLSNQRGMDSYQGLS